MTQSPPATATLIIFGASGDLTARKLVPALFQLANQEFIDASSPIIGCARREKTDEQFREEMFEAVQEAEDGDPIDQQSWERFAQRLFYLSIDLEESAAGSKLAAGVERIEAEKSTNGVRVVYLATAPTLFEASVSTVAAAGLIPDPANSDRLRVVIEKPFGHDLESSRELSRSLGQQLREEQIYRIDHYLGKETVQNILLFRFGNSIFEPLLNRNHVDHVQITVAESQGMERGRGGYYDQSGAVRDVLQNHVLQLLCLIAMEPPALFKASEIQDEKRKVLEALRPGDPSDPARWIAFGQYVNGMMNGEPVVGYRQEERVDPASRRETYVALEARVDNWRWAGVPFYLRTGKRLPQRVTEIAIKFQLPPLNLFSTVECEGDMCDLVGARPNTLIFRIQPHESISLRCSTKRPGMQYQIQPVTMDFEYDSVFERELPEAYERLLLDVLRGDPTLFTRTDELEAAWEFVQPVLDAWNGGLEPEPYVAGSWGPKAADELLGRSGRHWRRPLAKANSSAAAFE